MGVETLNEVGAALTAIVNEFDVLVVDPFVTLRVSEPLVPAVVGEPLITPVAVLKVSPAGSVPEYE